MIYWQAYQWVKYGWADVDTIGKGLLEGSKNVFQVLQVGHVDARVLGGLPFRSRHVQDIRQVGFQPRLEEGLEL